MSSVARSAETLAFPAAAAAASSERDISDTTSASVGAARSAAAAAAEAAADGTGEAGEDGAAAVAAAACLGGSSPSGGGGASARIAAIAATDTVSVPTGASPEALRMGREAPEASLPPARRASRDSFASPISVPASCPLPSAASTTNRISESASSSVASASASASRSGVPGPHSYAWSKPSAALPLRSLTGLLRSGTSSPGMSTSTVTDSCGAAAALSESVLSLTRTTLAAAPALDLLRSRVDIW
mmetsp:Transcript_15916/g.52439  ORF Transcript_15916/g.52439 Transcript_15916/m.52439 type:complete len:245 (-) Transcript_15916:31-765(-)